MKSALPEQRGGEGLPGHRDGRLIATLEGCRPTSAELGGRCGRDFREPRTIHRRHEFVVARHRDIDQRLQQRGVVSEDEVIGP